MTVDAPAPSGLSAWPAWRQEWVVFEDEALIALDKPAGIPTLGDARDEGDAVPRVRRFLAERGEERPTLGTHHLLDRETSGVVLFTRQKAANAPLAAQLEAKKVRFTFVAVVELSEAARLARRGELRHAGAPSKRGRTPPPITIRYREIERSGRRITLELEPSAGQTQLIRAALAEAGAPVVGDREHHGAAATRLMLHLARLELRHPTLDRPLVLAAPAPAAFLDAQSARDVSRLPSPEALPRLLEGACDLRYGLGQGGATDAYRLAHEGADGLPGVTVDRYGDYAVVGLSGDEAIEAREAILDAVAALGARGVYVKMRPKHASRIVDARREDYSPRLPMRGEQAPDPLPIREQGLAFEARLGDGLSTGMFLDQRDNRRRIRELARGSRFLNLFCYTASFTVAAVAGGAASSTSVDVSRAVLDWGRRHLDLAGADPARHVLVEADVLAWLAAQASGKARFDLCVLDPPSFATTKKSTFSAAHDYRSLAAATMRLLDRGGRLLACTNHRGIVRAKLRRYLHEAARDAGRTVEQMKDLPPGIDFPPPPGGEAFLKCVLVTLR